MPTLVVLDPLHLFLDMYGPPLEVHQVCSYELETGFQVFLGMTTVFNQFVKIVPNYWDIVILLLGTQKPDMHNQHKT